MSVRRRNLILFCSLALVIMISSLYCILRFGNPQWNKYIFLYQRRLSWEGPRPPKGYTGVWKKWIQGSGHLSSLTEYRNGAKHGKRLAWRSHGRRASEGTYVNGVRHGPWKQWDRDGTLSASGEYRDGRPWAGTCWWDGELYEYAKGNTVGPMIRSNTPSGGDVQTIDRSFSSGMCIDLGKADRLRIRYGSISDSGVKLERVTNGNTAWRVYAKPLGVAHPQYRHAVHVRIDGSEINIDSRASGGNFHERRRLDTGELIKRTQEVEQAL
jgi:hypothetical protein